MKYLASIGAGHRRVAVVLMVFVMLVIIRCCLSELEQGGKAHHGQAPDARVIL